MEGLEEKIERIDGKVEELVERTARLEAQVDSLKKEVELLRQMLSQRNGYMKWMIVLLGMILSFVAAMFGLGWRPP